MKSIFIYGEKNILHNYVNAFSTFVNVDCSKLHGKDLRDGLLLAGGGDVSPFLYGQKNTRSNNVNLERDYEELNLIQKYLSHGKPVFGICRGLQVLNVFFGGTLTQDVMGHSQQNDRDIYHSAKNERGSFTYNLYGENMLVNSAHHQVVDELANGLKVANYSSDGHIEALFSEKYPVFATQFHPERMIKGGLIIKYFCSILENA